MKSLSTILLAGVVLLATALPGATGQLPQEHILSAGEDIIILGASISIAGDVHANESIGWRAGISMSWGRWKRVRPCAPRDVESSQTYWLRGPRDCRFRVLTSAVSGRLPPKSAAAALVSPEYSWLAVSPSSGAMSVCRLSSPAQALLSRKAT